MEIWLDPPGPRTIISRKKKIAFQLSHLKGYVEPDLILEDLFEKMLELDLVNDFRLGFASLFV